MIALFVKPPIPGRVKTRLAREIGDTAACSIYYRLADHAIHQVQASGFPLALFFDSNDPNLLPAAWRAASRFCLSQQGADLGERMAYAFKSLFIDGVDQVVLIGSDIPDINASYLQRAFELLSVNQMVIGPTVDGGYCLIGFNRVNFSASVFQNMPWSTDKVFDLTQAAAKQAGLTLGLLPQLRDIDTAEDLQYGNQVILQID